MTSKAPSSSDSRGLRSFVFSWRFVLVLFYSAVALVFLTVVGSIVVNAVKNHGLVPPPSTLVRYDCNSGNAPFVLLYLHGTERVKISSASGVLEGTLHNNQFDWGSFANDASQLGFLPPRAISAEDTQSLSLQAADATAMRCTRAAPASGSTAAKQPA
ncbi:MAG: hypothetical protein ACKOWD_18755 [Rhodoferax sp.]